MNLPTNEIICGSAEEVIKAWPDESINCCISSPPYWGLRDYGVAGQLGLEPTFEEYIDKLCTIYDEVARVLTKDGTCWVNLGTTFQDKCDALIPERFVIEMVRRGWIKRRTVIWHKPNPMPSSVKDDFTLDFEYVFFFVKSKRYFFEPQYEPYSPESDAEYRATLRLGKFYRAKDPYVENTPYAGDREFKFNPLGRNKRAVWRIPTEPCPEAHFATYPRKLVEPMILAGCPKEVCCKCGKGRKKIYDIRYEKIGSGTVGGRGRFGPNDNSGFTGKPTMRKIPTEIGYTDCGCNAGFRPGIVCDPFAGSGTTCVVAAQLGRDYVGIELKQEYIDKIAIPKLAAVESGVPVKEQRIGQMALWE